MLEKVSPLEEVSSASNRPLISLGMPVYNDVAFIRQALRDIAAQTFRDFEVIISDNASSDGTSDICRAFAKEHGFVRYICQSQNIGARRNLQFTLEQARGKYFAWAASDDRRDPEFLRLLVGELEKSSKNASAFCSFVNIDRDDRVLEYFNFDFSGRFAPVRIAKFLFERNRRKDVIFYGLHRTDALRQAKFYKWWGPNENIVLRTAYPVIAFLLARGPYSHVNAVLFNSRFDLTRHRSNYASTARGMWRRLVDMNLLECNAYYAVLASVYQSTRSIGTLLVTCPIVLLALFFNLLLDNEYKALHLVRRLLCGAELSKRRI